MTFITLILFKGCQEPAIEPVDYPITLEVFRVGVTGARLKITIEGSDAGEFQLFRDDSLTALGKISGVDTILTDGNLLPNTPYTYRAYSLYRDEIADSSALISLMTKDTTSSIFTWQVDSIGSYVSILRDVAVITDDDIWAVGELGGWSDVPEERQYNALHWDGNEWELIWIKYKKLSTTIGPEYELSDVHSVFAIRSDAVWVAGSTPYFYDGYSWMSYQHENSNWSKLTHATMDIWGRDKDDVYFVGVDGWAHHWDGTDFTRIDLGTEYDLINVSGYQGHVFIVGRNPRIDYTFVYEFTGSQWSMLLESTERDKDPASGQWGGFYSVHVLEDMAYFGTSSGLLKYAYETKTFDLVPNADIGIPYYTIEEVSVVAPNDIHLFNFDDRYYHFNGLTWKRDDAHIDLGLHLRGADFHDNTAVMVGWLPGIGSMLIRGTR